MATDLLRVVHMITQLELGGAQRNTLYTVGHLNPSRYQVTLLCGEGGMLDAEAKLGHWSTEFIWSLVRPIRPWKDLKALILLYKRLRHIKPHIVHTHSSKAGILGRLAAYAAGVPVIIHTFHGFGFTPLQSKIVFRLFVTAERWCAKLSTHLIFVSEDNRAEAAALGIGTGKPASLIRSGIAPQSLTFGGRIREELGIPLTSWLIVSVGNFKPQKNPMDLVKTAEAVLQHDPSCHFVFVGDGELRSEVETYAQTLDLGKQIHFLGWRKDIPDILSVSDMFLLTSLWEGLPRALVEAGMARRPAVAYGVNGVKDILKDGETGFLIEPHNVVQAAEKVLWLKNHPLEARQLGEAARHRVEKEFDIDLMVRQQEELYESLYANLPLKAYYEPLWNS